MNRLEFNCQTGVSTTIALQAYKDSSDNVYVLDVGENPPNDYIAISDDEAITINLLKSSVPKITEVTRAQAKHALLQIGLLDTVEMLIPTMGRAAQIDWADRPTVQRSNAWVIEAQLAMNWTDAELDGLFTVAATL